MIINVGPCVLGTNDPNHGNNNVAEVVLTESQNTFFAGMIGIFYGNSAGISKMNLIARAEAGEAYICLLYTSIRHCQGWLDGPEPHRPVPAKRTDGNRGPGALMPK